MEKTKEIKRIENKLYAHSKGESKNPLTEREFNLYKKYDWENPNRYRKSLKQLYVSNWGGFKESFSEFIWGLSKILITLIVWIFAPLIVLFWKIKDYYQHKRFTYKTYLKMTGGKNG